MSKQGVRHGQSWIARARCIICQAQQAAFYEDACDEGHAKVYWKLTRRAQ